jgi:hypothetical protein
LLLQQRWDIHSIAGISRGRGPLGQGACWDKVPAGQDLAWALA